MTGEERLSWRHTASGVAVKRTSRVDGEEVPDAIARYLVGPDGVGVTEDPAEDLLRVEARLQVAARDLAARVAEAERAVAAAREDAEEARTAGMVHRQVRRRRTERVLRQAIADHAEIAGLLDEARDLLDMARTWVTGLNLTSGPLHAAAAGWARSPQAPASVVVFADEQEYITADIRRVTVPPWGGHVVTGDVFGSRWRRDGDDDLTGLPQHAGVWEAGFLTRTREVYAVRRSAMAVNEVWLLGSGLDPLAARRVLAETQQRMPEPNSLILLAEQVAGLVAHRVLLSGPEREPGADADSDGEDIP